MLIGFLSQPDGGMLGETPRALFDMLPFTAGADVEQLDARLRGISL